MGEEVKIEDMVWGDGCGMAGVKGAGAGRARSGVRASPGCVMRWTAEGQAIWVKVARRAIPT